MAEKFSMVSPYNYALNSPLKVIDPDGMEALPLDGQMIFSGYVGDDGLGNYSGSRKGDKPKKDDKNIIPSMKVTVHLENGSNFSISTQRGPRNNEDKLQKLAIMLASAKAGDQLSDFLDFKYFNDFKKIGDPGGGYRNSGILNNTSIDFYTGQNITFNRFVFLAEGKGRGSEFAFSRRNLVESNFPIINPLNRKELLNPYALRIKGFFDERISNIATLRFSDWNVFYNFSNTILKGIGL